MKKILSAIMVITITLSLVFPVKSYADSPVTSTDFYSAYLDIDEVSRAVDMFNIDPETAQYLSDPGNPIDVKAAVINAISWSTGGKDNAERYSGYIFDKPLSELDMDSLSAHDLFCIGYLLVMDDYFNPERALPVMEKALSAMGDSFTVSMVTAIVKAQIALGNRGEWHMVWKMAEDVVQNKDLKQDMRPEAIEIIIDYLVLYREDSSEDTSENIGEDINTEAYNHKSHSDLPADITKKPLTLTYFSVLPTNTQGVTDSLSDVEVYKELERRTNIKISFIHTSKDAQFNKLMLMAAAGDLPDLIEFPWQSNRGALERFAEIGVIIELNELIEKAAPNLNGIIELNNEARRQITSDNGRIYRFPGFNLAENRVYAGPVVRSDLLKKYGLEIPETLEEWEEMLMVFRDSQDCMIPLSFDMSALKNSKSFMGAFNVTHDFGVKNGKVFYGPIDESYKDFLSVFSQWYKKGLIDREFIILRNNEPISRVSRGEVGAFIGTINNLEESIYTLSAFDPEFELIPVQNPVCESGGRLNITSRAWEVSESGVAVSSRNKHPEESVRWLDYAYSEEGYKLFNFGIEGLTYAEEGGQMKYTDVILNNPDGLAVSQAMGRYLRAAPPVPGFRTDYSIEEILRYPQQKDAINLWSGNLNEDSFSLMPPISLTQEESFEINSIMNNIGTYTDEMFAKYVIGMDMLDSFDKYVETVKKMGIDRAVYLMQSALYRYNNRLDGDKISMMVNGKQMEMDTDPIIISGRPILPIRFVIEGLGGSVEWDGRNKTVTAILDDTVIVLKMNSADAMVNNEPETLNMEVMPLNDRTYVPVEFIEENLGVNVDWDENTRMVIIH